MLPLSEGIIFNVVEYRLKFKPKIGRSSSNQMILLFVKHGDHDKQIRYKSDADIKRMFASNGIRYQDLVDECLDFSNSVPYFENSLLT